MDACAEIDGNVGLMHSLIAILHRALDNGLLMRDNTGNTGIVIQRSLLYLPYFQTSQLPCRIQPIILID